MRFNLSYFSVFLFILTVELLIAFGFKDNFVRPFLGDFLVVILIYCFIKSFFNVSSLILAVAVLLFAFIIEISQYFQLIKLLHLERYLLAKLILGTTFEWLDFVAYTAGIILIIGIEYFAVNYSKKSHK